MLEQQLLNRGCIRKAVAAVSTEDATEDETTVACAYILRFMRGCSLLPRIPLLATGCFKTRLTCYDMWDMCQDLGFGVNEGFKPQTQCCQLASRSCLPFLPQLAIFRCFDGICRFRNHIRHYDSMALWGCNSQILSARLAALRQHSARGLGAVFFVFCLFRPLHGLPTN